MDADSQSKSDRGKRDDEFAWKDLHRCHGRVIGYREVRLEQPDCPEDVVALLEVGESPKPHPNGIDSIIMANPVYLTADQAVEVALQLLDAATAGRQTGTWPPAGPVAAGDHERRWRLHVHACSIEDSTFWVERRGDLYKATEVETGVTGAVASSSREALNNYFEGRLWDAESARAFDEPEAPSHYEVVRMFDGTWNVREQPSGDWVRDSVHFVSKAGADRRAAELNAALPSREQGETK